MHAATYEVIAEALETLQIKSWSASKCQVHFSFGGIINERDSMVCGGLLQAGAGVDSCSTRWSYIACERDCLQAPHHLDMAGLPVLICRTADLVPILQELHSCHFSHERL